MFFFKKGLIINILLVANFMTMAMATPARGNNSSKNSYNPPPAKRIKQKRTVGSGSRGLCQRLFPKGSLTLLVPEPKVVHYTTLSRPSFYLYARATSDIPLVFNLIIPDPTVDNPIAEKNVTISRTGLYKLELPADVELEAERIYFWQIGIPCENDLEQTDQVLKAAVQKIPVSAELAIQLKENTLPLKKARQLANWGICYDAFSLAVEQAQGSSSTHLVRQLVEEIGVDLETNYLSSFGSVGLK